MAEYIFPNGINLSFLTEFRRPAGPWPSSRDFVLYAPQAATVENREAPPDPEEGVAATHCCQYSVRQKIGIAFGGLLSKEQMSEQISSAGKCRGRTNVVGGQMSCCLLAHFYLKKTSF